MTPSPDLDARASCCGKNQQPSSRQHPRQEFQRTQIPDHVSVQIGSERALGTSGAGDAVNQDRLRCNGAAGARHGDGDRREVAIEEARVERHERAVQRMKGLVGAAGAVLTIVHLAIDYFRR